MCVYIYIYIYTYTYNTYTQYISLPPQQTNDTFLDFINVRSVFIISNRKISN